MRLSDSIARLAALRADPANAARAGSGGLQELHGFGSNPGNLNAWFHVPEGHRKAQAMVVVLHGCTQNAAAYDHGAGWTQLADEQGFAVLYPEQSRSIRSTEKMLRRDKVRRQSRPRWRLLSPAL